MDLILDVFIIKYYYMKTEILSGLWLSSNDEITESKFLLEKNLDFIVNCST